MREEVLDFRSLSTLCGDYTVHILEKLEELERGGRLRVVASAEERDLVKAAVETITANRLARLVEERELDGVLEVVLEKA